MSKNILVIGGAGFIGSHLVDKLLLKNHQVTVYDVLEPQVHGNINEPPDYLAKNINFLRNDIRSRNDLLDSIEDIEIIYHLAALTGIGQSMYQIERFIDVNSYGTAKLLKILIEESNNVKKLIVASSNTIYGEGRYFCEKCGSNVNPKIRKLNQLEKRAWELKCPSCKDVVKPIPTDEEKPPDCSSIYALSKKDQEKMCLLIGETYGINTTALRFFNTYGSRQSLSNPYTGVCAIFSTNLLCGNAPLIYEDGNQTRDLVHVSDICQALVLSMEKPQARNQVFNVGNGKPVSIKKIAQVLGSYINPNISPEITNKYRLGDIRHCYADIKKISSRLGYKPTKEFEDGMKELNKWVKLQRDIVFDKSNKVNKELNERGLLK